MNSKAQNIFNRLEADRAALLDYLSSIPVERLSIRPDSKHWSINHILIHLLTSERLTLAYMRKKSLGIDGLKNAGPWEFFKLLLLQFSQRLPMIKYRAPRYLVENTPGLLTLGELTAQWNFSRNELKHFLDAIQEKDIHKLIYKHPVAGRFDAIQCLIFMREHFHHHLPQIKRLV